MMQFRCKFQLKQIAELESKYTTGASLTAEQQEKLSKRVELEAELARLS
jgi:hypothetical protein